MQVRNLSLHNSVSAMSFLDHRGCIVVGTQTHLHAVKCEDFLPFKYKAELTALEVEDDQLESPLDTTSSSVLRPRGSNSNVRNLDRIQERRDIEMRLSKERELLESLAARRSQKRDARHSPKVRQGNEGSEGGDDLNHIDDFSFFFLFFLAVARIEERSL